MKLSHRDFRPQKRFRYVAQPPKRRPTIRILLLLVFGGLVYLKFDSVVSSRVAQMLLHPGRIIAALSNANSPKTAQPLPNLSDQQLAIRWSSDSSQLELSCLSGDIEACLHATQGLESNIPGIVRSLIQKVALQWNRTPTQGFSAQFISQSKLPGMPRKLALQRLEFFSDRDPIVLKSTIEGDGIQFCTAQACLDQMSPRHPFWKFQGLQERLIHPMGVNLRPRASLAFHPILSGRVVAINSDPAEIKIYHGRNLFSSYAGFSRLDTLLKIDGQVNPGDTLGFAGVDGDSLAGITLRIEKDGLYVDPLDFMAKSQSETNSDGKEIALGKAEVAHEQ